MASAPELMVIIVRSSLQGDARLLQQMNVEERLVADYVGTGFTVGNLPMHYRRPELRRSNILSAEELRTRRDGPEQLHLFSD